MTEATFPSDRDRNEVRSETRSTRTNASVQMWTAPQMDSPPSRSGGRNELSDEGVARWSCESGHSAANPPQPSFCPPRHAPPPPEPRCCRIICTSDSAGDSAKMVVLLSTQLFRAIWALAASSRVEQRARARPWFKYRWKFWSGPCWTQSVFRVDPSI